MVKKKNAPALFELIYKGKGTPSDQLSVPAWMSGPKKPPRMPPERPPQAQGGGAVEESLATGRPAEAPGARVKSKRLGRLREKLVTAQGQRLRVTITPAQAILAGAVVVLVAVVVFLLGLLVTHGSSASRAPQQAGAPPVAPDGSGGGALAARAGETPGPPAGGGARSGELGMVPGKYYLVIQGLMGMTDEQRSEAEEIARFLNSRDEPVAVMVYRGPPRQYVVVSLRGFDVPDNPRAKAYMQAVEELGKLYRSQGGRYDFRQGERGWFVTP